MEYENLIELVNDLEKQVEYWKTNYYIKEQLTLSLTDKLNKLELFIENNELDLLPEFKQYFPNKTIF